MGVLWLSLGCRPGGEVLLARVPVHEEADVEALHRLGDVWTEHPLDEALVAVASRRAAELPADAEVLHPDLGPLIEASLVPFGDGFYEAWSDLDALHDRMEELAAAHPAAELVELGSSVEGRPILGLRIGEGGYDHRRGTLVTGGVHAREWVAVHSALYIAERLLADDGVDPVVTDALDTEKWLVVPVVNPDGYRHTWTTDRLWRKNRRDNGNGSFGVDLNRNFDVGFGGPGSDALPASNNHRGPSALSEPEAEALAEFLASHPRFDRVIDLHCTGQLALSPWGHTLDAPLDDELLAVAEAAAEAMTDTHGVPYDGGQTSQRLYLASGTWVDHAYGRMGTHSLLIELRDRGHYGFLLPAEQLLPTAEEAWAGVWEVMAADVLQLGLVQVDDGVFKATRADGPVWLAVSRTGEGSAVTGGLTPDLQLDQPLLFGPVDPSATGGARFRMIPPAGWQGVDLWWQAATATRRSPVVHTLP
jgi:murein tripeptide amidase MpaA